MNKSGATSINTVLTLFALGILVIGGVAVYGAFFNKASIIGSNAEPVAVDTRQGVASTVSLKYYDQESTTPTTSVYPDVVWIDDSTGARLLNGAAGNSTSSVKGEKLTVRIGGTNYYGEAYSVKDVLTEAPTFAFNVHALASEGSMLVDCQDTSGTTLTADDNTTNVADYAVDMGASQDKIIFCKLTNNQANKLYRLGAICTFAGVNVSGTDDFTVETDGQQWSSAYVPKEVRNAALSFANDAGTAMTRTGFTNCYVPPSPIELKGWGDTGYIKFVMSSGTTAPVANGGNVMGALFIDSAYSKGKDGKIMDSYYQHDDDEKVTGAGLSDTTTSPQGLTSGVLLELY